jgi:lysozyme family protein
MTILDDMITDILDREGRVYENHPNDRGGPTKFGITLGRLQQERGRATWQDVRDLTEAEARAIYKNAYYDRPKIERLPDELEAAVFDFYVNSGTWAIKKLQQMLNQLGFKCAIDGGIGPETVRQSYACLAKYDAGSVLKLYFEIRREFFRSIVRSNPTQSVFLKGWLNRVDKLEKQVLEGGWIATTRAA